jgi:hypothetical protein
MNLIFNHLNFCLNCLGWAMTIGLALIVADWIELRLSTYFEVKPVKQPQNQPQSNLSKYRLSYEEM